MAYPDLPISTSSEINLQRNIAVEASDDGTVWGRDLSKNTIYQFSVVHELLTEDEKDTILNYFESNTNSTFTLTYDGVDYDCIFSNSGFNLEIVKNGIYNVTTNLIGTKQG